MIINRVIDILNRTDEIYDYCVEITNGPGKFEGCIPWIPYFWNISLECSAQEEDGYFYSDIEPIDAIIFPELEKYIGKQVKLWEDESGFVYGEIYNG